MLMRTKIHLLGNNLKQRMHLKNIAAFEGITNNTLKLV